MYNKYFHLFIIEIQLENKNNFGSAADIVSRKKIRVKCANYFPLIESNRTRSYFLYFAAILFIKMR
jgi:hypothetical protein